MRRMVKEELLTLRRQAAVPRAPRLHRHLSSCRDAGGAALRRRSPSTSREEMNRADRLKAEGEGRRGNSGRLRADRPAAPAGVLARGDLPVAARRRRKRLEDKASEVRGRAARRTPLLAASEPAARCSSDGSTTWTTTSTICDGAELEELEEELVDAGHRRADDRRARARDRDPHRPRSAGRPGAAVPGPTRSGPSCPALLADAPEMFDAGRQRGGS